ncbi:hypothetical protein HDU91_000264 [Kappamyces sp. JEL0680]|nr:hypothetical protein HDU91_000264 [Kappamyces sp. JEL0680]
MLRPARPFPMFSSHYAQFLATDATLSSGAPEQQHDKVLTKAFAQIHEMENSLALNFENTDLPLLRDNFVEVQTLVRQQFADHPFWKLFWSGDYFVSDLEKQLEQHSLLKAEYQMSYAAGKIAGYTSNLPTVVGETVRASVTSPGPQHDPAVDIHLKELDYLTLPNQTADCIQSTDPFLLRNQVATFTVDYKELGDRIQRLVKSQAALQLSLAAFWVLSVHFGVPIPVAVPAGLFTSALGLFWMNLRYTSIQKSFMVRLGESQKLLLSKLKDIHYSAVTAATGPLKATLQALESSLNKTHGI